MSLSGSGSGFPDYPSTSLPLPPSPAHPTLLSRARSILAPSGNLIPELRRSPFSDTTTTPVHPPSSHKPSSTLPDDLPPRRRNLGASIRSTLRDVRNSSSLPRPLSLNLGFATRSRSSPTTNKTSALRSTATSATATPHHHDAAPAALDPDRSDFDAVYGPPAARTLTPSPQPVIVQESTATSSSSISTSSPQDVRPVDLDVTVLAYLGSGTAMTKVSANKQSRVIIRVDADQGQILCEGQKQRIIPIENIKELRVGADARYYREQFQLSQEYEDRWLTIIYIADGQYKILHLVAPTKDVFRMWDVSLQKLHGIRMQLMSEPGNLQLRQAVWEKQYWKGADMHKDQSLVYEELQKLCKRLHISTASGDLLRLFKEADTRNRGYLDFDDFRRLVKLLKARPDLDQLYKKLCTDHCKPFNFSVFEAFMRDSQKSTLTREELKVVFGKYADTKSHDASSSLSLDSAGTAQRGEPTTAGAADSLAVPVGAAEADQSSPAMTAEGFSAFLLSADNPAAMDQTRKVWHDMTRPLPEYYISSSHNTYLVGNQLVGVSTIEGYIRALLHSCRSVELDVYDGETEPMIYHGKTLTSKITLREVCAAIAKYAFVASPYPVIISAEVHCGLTQQDMIAKIMVEAFGDALVSAPIDDRPKIVALPSPEDLKGRILLKAKSLYATENEGNEKQVVLEAESSETSSTEFETPEVKSEWDGAVRELKHEFAKARNLVNRIRGRSPSPSLLPPPPAAADVPITRTTSATSTGPRNSSPAGGDKREKRTVKMSLSLVVLLVYTVGVKCRGINKKEPYAPEHIFSLSENTANKYLRQQSAMLDLIKHSRTHLVRIYPKGMRLSSSNYEPHRFWAAGAQLVAINWQTCDQGFMINHAMFQRNGRAGYVLKPLALREMGKELLTKYTKHVLDVTVISAQQVPRAREVAESKSSVDPYVEVSLHVPDWPTTMGKASTPPPTAGTARTSYIGGGNGGSGAGGSGGVVGAGRATCRTCVIKDNGFNPVWQERLCLPFECVGDMMDLVFVRFAVKQEGLDEPLGVYCASLGSLQRGYRHLPLHDLRMSQFLFSTLFVKIDVVDA